MSNLPTIVQERGIDLALWETLKNSIFPGAKPESIIMAVDYCKARKLDVLKKPCHIVPMNVKDAKSGAYTWRDVIMPGIAEYRTTAFRTGTYAGQDEPLFGDEITYMGVKAPLWCKVTVYRMQQGIRCPYSHIEYFEEAVALKKDKQNKIEEVNAMWTKRPRGQLAKCAEAGALRKAFPEELGGETIADEMEGKELFMGEAQREHSSEKEPVKQPQPKPKQEEPKQTKDEPPATPEEAEKPKQTKAKPRVSGCISPGQQNMLRVKIKHAGVQETDVCAHFEMGALEELPAQKINEALVWVMQQGKKNDNT